MHIAIHQLGDGRNIEELLAPLGLGLQFSVKRSTKSTFGVELRLIREALDLEHFVADLMHGH